jgi:ATP-binding cassette subfamily B protein
MARNTFEQDEEDEGGIRSRYVLRLLGYLAPYGKRVSAAIALMFGAALVSLAGPYLIKLAIDVAIPNRDEALLIKLALLLVAAVILALLFQRTRVLIMTRIGQDVIVRIRKDVFTKLQQLPFTYFDSRPHGKILIRVVNYVNSLSELLSSGFIQFIADLFSLALIIVFMLIIDVRLTFVCMAGLPLLFAAVFAVKRRQHAAWQNVSRKQANLNAYLSESLSGMKVTQSFAREGENKRIFNRLSDAWKQVWMRAVRVTFTIWPVIDIISTVGVCLVYCAGVWWYRGTVSVGTLVAFSGYIWRFWAPIQNIGNFYNAMVTTGAYMERIFELIDEKVDVIDEPDARPLPPIRGHVRFDDVRFSYEAGHPVLAYVDFIVEPGKSIAVVGPTGAGKTTIVNLLSRFYNPDSGKVLIDGIDLASVTISSVRQQVGVMLQDSFLFSASVRENIRYGRLDATDEEVEAAAKAVCAHGFITSMQDGYDTQVAERGMRLSMGERQLIAFARVLLSDPRILILDEATSSVDTETERALQKGLQVLLKGRTSFIIAHRLSTIRNADTIFFIDKGRILEAGTHDELEALGGAYCKLYATA